VSDNNSNINGILCVVLASIFWGTTGTAASLVPEISPLATGAFAMGVGGLLLLWNARHHLFADRKILFKHPKLLICGGVCVASYPLAFYTSMRFSGVAIGNLISIASAPFFSVLLERFISKKQIKLQWFVSFILGTLGIILLTMGKQDSTDLETQTNLNLWGILLGLIAALTYAVYSWAGRQMIEQGVSSKSSMASMFGFAAVLLLPSLFITGENIFSDAKHISVMLYMAIVPMFLGYLLFGYALKHLEASTATLITLLEPAVATLLAVSIVGEKFATIGWYGFLSIIACLALQVVQFPSKQHKTVNNY